MWVELTSKLMYKLWAVEWIRERSSDQNSFFVPWRVLLFQGRCLWSWSEVPEEEESVRSLKGSPSRCRPAEPANALPARRHREKSAKKWYNTRPNSVIHGADVDFCFLYYYLLFAIPTLSLHSLHQLHQFVYERLLGGQQRAHHSHTLISLKEIRVQVKQFLHQFVGLVVPNVACDKPVVMSLNCNFHQRPRPTALFSVTGN